MWRRTAKHGWPTQRYVRVMIESYFAAKSWIIIIGGQATKRDVAAFASPNEWIDLPVCICFAVSFVIILQIETPGLQLSHQVHFSAVSNIFRTIIQLLHSV